MRTYGQRFLDSFAQRVDKRIKLLCYVEDCMPVNPDPRQIEIIDARTSIQKESYVFLKYAHRESNPEPPP